MNYLFLDQSLTNTGFWIYTPDKLTTGLIKTVKKESYIKRIAFIANTIADLVEKYEIDEVIMEAVYSQRGPRDCYSLLKVEACIQYMLLNKRIPFSSVLATTRSKKSWRSVFSLERGKKSSKEFLQQRGLDTKLSEHQCDAILIGWAHLINTKRLNGIIDKYVLQLNDADHLLFKT